jgi:hypothetical protein
MCLARPLRSDLTRSNPQDNPNITFHMSHDLHPLGVVLTERMP